jgi:hypothetical protein
MLTENQLRENYFYACLCVAGAPYQFRTDFQLCDYGLQQYANPQIFAWNVTGVQQPTDEQMLNTLSMTDINNVKAQMQQ